MEEQVQEEKAKLKVQAKTIDEYRAQCIQLNGDKQQFLQEKSKLIEEKSDLKLRIKQLSKELEEN